MSAKKTDISQIRKYLNGELDAHAMHQLEREAQDDPFLMDAMEGYEAATGLQQRPLDELDSRLQQRIDQSKVRRMISWKYLAAASVLIVFTLGYLLWPAQVQKQPQEQKIAVAKTPAPADHPVTLPDAVLQLNKTQTLAANKPMPELRVANVGPRPDAVVKSDANEAIRIDEPVGNSDAKVVVEYKDTTAIAAAPLKTRAKDTAVLREITIARAGGEKRAASASNGYIAQSLQGKLAGAQVTTPSFVSGRVMDEMGIPLPGVTVQVQGTSKGTYTDINGRFSLPAGDKEMLDIRYVGYANKIIKAEAKDSMKIALSPDTRSLAEVVVVGYGQSRIKPGKTPHPRTGWDNYNQYLKRAAIANDHKGGNVRLSFTVDEKGNFNDFKIIKGLSEVSNKQAIDIVKDGPAWAPDASGKPKTVKLKIHFANE